jgi:hypothetical protein
MKNISGVLLWLICRSDSPSCKNGFVGNNNPGYLSGNMQFEKFVLPFITNPGRRYLSVRMQAGKVCFPFIAAYR